MCKEKDGPWEAASVGHSGTIVVTHKVRARWASGFRAARTWHADTASPV